MAPDQSIDLRSDTVTRPTPAMRAAMAQAPVGDDVFGEDPSVCALEEEFATLAGKQAAMFVPSGTMANQIAIRCHTQPGDEVICDAGSHIVHYEAGGPAVISGVSIRCVEGERGVMTVAQVEQALRPAKDIHAAVSRLLVIENTHNRGGGTVWPHGQLAQVCAAAREWGLARHLDGARIFNAVVATGIPLAEWLACFDSAAVCFSKGLGAPVGSILAGPDDFIVRARRVRKMLGGGMRQAGILAEGARHAMGNHVARLAEDHANAATIAELLMESGVVRVEQSPPPTNMVYFCMASDSADPRALVRACREAGVHFAHVGGGRFRAVTHLDVGTDAARHAAAVIVREAERLVAASV